MKEALIEKARVHEELRTMKAARGNQPGKRMGNYPPGTNISPEKSILKMIFLVPRVEYLRKGGCANPSCVSWYSN